MQAPAEANEQMRKLVTWLRTAVLDAGLATQRPVLQPKVRELPIATRLFRLTRAPDERFARELLGKRPTFFATIDPEVGEYRECDDLGARGRLVKIRGITRFPLKIARADQFHIVRAIYLGIPGQHGNIGPFPALWPPPYELEDSPPIRIQRWIVPIAVGRAVGQRLDALARDAVPEITVAEPLAVLDLTFDWLEP